MSRFDVRDGGWLPRRGDYNANYAVELIPMVEATSCSLGCTKSGTQAERDEWGPGGTCSVLATLGGATERVPIEPRDDGPDCKVREAPDAARCLPGGAP